MTSDTAAADRWQEALDALAPAVGERVARLIAVALLRSAGAGERAEAAAADLRAEGDDPDAPVVTEVEGLLLAWARDAGAGREADPAVAERLQAVVSPGLRTRLDDLAAAARAL